MTPKAIHKVKNTSFLFLLSFTRFTDLWCIIAQNRDIAIPTHDYLLLPKNPDNFAFADLKQAAPDSDKVFFVFKLTC